MIPKAIETTSKGAMVTQSVQSNKQSKSGPVQEYMLFLDVVGSRIYVFFFILHVCKQSYIFRAKFAYV